MGPVPAAGIALALTVCLAPAVLWILRRHQILDQPNERSSHDRPIARGGGLALAVGASVGLLLCTQVDPTARSPVLFVALAMAVIGLVDDVRGLPPIPRLVAQLLVAALSLTLLAVSFRGPLLWLVVFSGGVVLWIVGYVNAFNFMDGINGMAVAQVVVAGVAWWLIGRQQHVGSLAAGGLVAAAGAAGFAPFNVVQPRMFLGDIGSYFLGGWLAAVAVLGVRAGVAPEAVLAPLALYLADTATTLVRRILHHESWYTAHREHAYQRLVDRGWTHARTTVFAGAAMIACAALGAVSLTGSPAARVVADVLGCAVLASYLITPSLASRSGTATITT